MVLRFFVSRICVVTFAAFLLWVFLPAAASATPPPAVFSCEHLRQYHPFALPTLTVLLLLAAVLGALHIQLSLRLASQKRLYRELLDSLSARVLIFHPVTAEILDANSAALESSGVAATADLNAESSWSASPYSLADARELVRRAVAEGSLCVEWKRHHVSGLPLWEEVTLKTITINGKLTVLATCQDITRRKASEDALRESEERYRAVIGVMNEGVTIQQADGTIVSCNPAIERILGLEPGQLLGSSMTRLNRPAIYPDGSDFPSEERPTQKALRTGLPQRNVVMGVVRQNQQVTWLLCNSEPLFFHDIPEPSMVVTTAIDITALHEAKRHLDQSQLWLQQFAEHTDTVFWVSSPDCVNYISPAYEKVWGYSCQSLYDAPASFLNALHPDDRAATQETIYTLSEQRLGFDLEYRIIRADGRVRWIHARTFPLHDDRGEFTGWVGVADDITEHKEHEIMLQDFSIRMVKEIEAELSQRMQLERRYQTLVEQSPDGVLLLNGQGQVISANPAAGAILGVDIRELIGVRPWKLFQTTQLLGAQEESVAPQSMLMQLKQQRKARFAWNITVPGGQTKNIEVIITDIGKKDSEHFLMLWRDNTEVRQLQQEKRMHEALLIQKSKEAEMGSMIDTIAHQWKQPLNNVAILAQQLQEIYRDNELTAAEMDFHVARILDQVDYMSETVSDFRRFYSASSELESFDLWQQTNAVLMLLKPRLDACHVKLRMQEPVTLMVRGYTSEYRQVILCIVNNAIDAFDEHQSDEKILTITFHSHRDAAEVCICDNAGGIAQELLPHKLFEPFTTTKGARGGTGIGLSLSRTIIGEKMSGQLMATNRDNGACFTIVLPVSP
ncbi:PAS sensor protein [Desulfurispirillum indicum S5]|uniref:histidine kinase n=1 Tax=Desulfurispirillum indicum (strain ATCC BAA-1389 / DSM 22839 / S5) TaxID=653733 RepID=E6W4Y8_DESIS|nr:PAS domain S-box protein [Desulfurispirillum indicum]ADU65964.1 PAS sensor protein [Desulfurispirillum indicum S5]